MKKLVSLLLVLILALCTMGALAEEAEPKRAVLVMRTLSDTFAATFANELLTQA